MLKQTGRPAGRPPKQGELLEVERGIKFTPTMYGLLQDRQEKTGVPIAEQVRRAVERDFSGNSAAPVSIVEEVRRAIAEARGGIVLNIDGHECEQLARVGESFGYEDVTAFAAEMLRVTLDKSEVEIENYLVRRALRENEPATATEEIDQNERSTHRTGHNPV